MIMLERPITVGMIVLFILVAGCAPDMPQSGPDRLNEIEKALPIYKGARITGGGGTNDHVIKILATQDNVYEVAAFFEKELHRKGWQDYGSGGGESPGGKADGLEQPSLSFGAKLKSICLDISVERVDDDNTRITLFAHAR